jgi:TRAP-type C4-dicarboxylate transport system substrate-binding protein
MEVRAGTSAGSDDTFVRAIAGGSVDLAMVTAVGLGSALPAARVLEAPGALSSASEVTAARAAVASELDALLEAQDLVRLGWLDYGEARLFSTGSVVSPGDLAGRHTWVHPGDAVVEAILRAAGGPSVALPLERVLGALGSGGVDTVVTSAFAASGLTWSSHLGHVGDRPLFHVGGMTVMRRSTYLALPAEARAALDATAASAHARLATMIRQSDERAYAALTTSGGLTVDAMSGTAWDATCRTARTALAGATYPRALLSEVEAAGR